LVHHLIAHTPHEVVAAVRRQASETAPSPTVSVGSIDGQTDWSHALRGVDVVVHAAAEVPGRATTDDAFQRTNVEGTRELARQAVAAGVKRFVFISTIKVHGDSHAPNHPCRATDQLDRSPDPYAESKRQAEQLLRAPEIATHLDVVIVRPPLVYGPGVKGNLRALMNWIHNGLPLPLASVDNRRSLVGVGNLADFLSACITHPDAPGRTFLVSDDADPSTPELLRHLGAALGTQARLLGFPPGVMQRAAELVGKSGVYERLCGSLVADIEDSKRVLAWQPPRSLGEGLREVGRHFLSEAGRKTLNSRGLRAVDLMLATSGLVATSPLLCMILLLGLLDTGSPLFTQTRVGSGQRPFTLLKFRTMRPDTGSVATHLVSPASITRLGRVLRKTKLDELPQLVNVVRGEMSFVGPRPCLPNQDELRAERDARGVFDVLPGITGLAQVNGIDMSQPERLAQWDERMINGFRFVDYFKYIAQTAIGRGSGDRVVAS
jgi:lipopolysaccharide/colanic/teichoic acid biosynthesis glycosyltransferase/nucleoside-diphosphate-sugar epimerase